MSAPEKGVINSTAGNYQQQLCAANGFTWDDVLENRAGRISAQQSKVQSKDARSRVGGIVGGVFLVLLGLGVAIMTLSSESGSLYPLMGVGLAIWGIYQIVSKSKKADNPVESFEGVLKKKSVLRQSGGGSGLVGALAAAAVDSALNMRDYYYECEGGPAIKVSREGHDALQEGQRYRVYYTPSSLLLLSVEVL